MHQKFWMELFGLTVGWFVAFFIVRWLVEGSFWLQFFLATALTSAQGVRSQLIDKINYRERQIADLEGELYRINSVSTDQELSITDLKEQIAYLETRIADLEEHQV